MRVLCESKYGDKSALLCADASSNFLVSTRLGRQITSHFVSDDLLLAVGHGSSFLMEGLSLEEIEKTTQAQEAMKGLKIDLKQEEEVGLLRFSARKKVLFQKTFGERLDGEMMADSYREALKGWYLVRANSKVETRATVLLVRANQTYEARLLRMQPDDGNIAHGLVLEIRRDESPILCRFGLLARAIAQGNAFVQPHKTVVYRERSEIHFFGPKLELISENGAPLHWPGEADPMFEYTLNNVRTTVVPVPSGGCHIEVFVDDHYISSVFRDMGRGSHPFPLPQAIREAQDLLKALQGWTTQST